jgi:prepilin-type N-terminal cleavage/methylation domain-containing protein
MKHRHRQNGLTLVELVVVVAILAVLLGISVPTAKKLIDSLEHSAGAHSLINAALTSARAMAVSRGGPGYVGVRFQQDSGGDQYIIFIEYDPPQNADVLAYGFRAVKGRKPMRLPKDIGVIDGLWVTRNYGGIGELLPSSSENSLNDTVMSDNPANLLDGKNIYLNDATTFSIVFSSTGQMVYHELWVCNKDMLLDRTVNPDPSLDPVFNWKNVVDAGNSMFYQDDYGGSGHSRYPQNRGIGPEMSRRSIIIYNKKQLSETSPTARWSGYLGLLQPEFVNPYSGQLIKK